MNGPINHADLRHGPAVIPADAWMRLRIAGDLLSTVALNASRSRVGLSPRAVQSLAECSVEWDAARDAVHQLLQERSRP